MQRWGRKEKPMSILTDFSVVLPLLFQTKWYYCTFRYVFRKTTDSVIYIQIEWKVYNDGIFLSWKHFKRLIEKPIFIKSYDCHVEKVWGATRITDRRSTWYQNIVLGENYTNHQEKLVHGTESKILNAAKFRSHFCELEVFENIYPNLSDEHVWCGKLVDTVFIKSYCGQNISNGEERIARRYPIPI